MPNYVRIFTNLQFCIPYAFFNFKTSCSSILCYAGNLYVLQFIE